MKITVKIPPKPILTFAMVKIGQVFKCRGCFPCLKISDNPTNTNYYSLIGNFAGNALMDLKVDEIFDIEEIILKKISN